MEKKIKSVRDVLKKNFSRYRAKDVVLVRKLQRSSILVEDDLVELLLYWHSSAEPGQTLLDFLIANEVLNRDAIPALGGGGSSKLKNVDRYINEEGLAPAIIRIENYKQDSLRNQTPANTTNDASISARHLPESKTIEVIAGIKSTFPKVGMLLGKCRLTKMIGRGTSGIVYHGVHETLQIPVAVKVFLPQNHTEAKVIRKQFGAEAHSLAKLNHRSIVRILDFEDGLHPYLILEYVDGKSLEELIRERGRIDYQQAAYYIYCVAGGLSSAHETGIIHRDIKPANILVTKNDEAKLADLGIAKLTTALSSAPLDESVSTGSLPGTPAYIAPELAFTSNIADARSDIYSLGATFYHTVTGQHPFAGESAYLVIMKHVHEALTPPHEVVSEIPEELSTLIQKMMAKKPDERYQSVEEMLPDLLMFFLGSGFYSIDNTLEPLRPGSDTPMFGAKTRVLLNTAKKMIDYSRENKTTNDNTADK